MKINAEFFLFFIYFVTFNFIEQKCMYIDHGFLKEYNLVGERTRRNDTYTRPISSTNINILADNTKYHLCT